MRTKIAVGFMVLVVVPVLAGCDKTSKASNPGPVTPATLEVAGPNPSVSAKMICGEAKEGIAAVVGVDTARPIVSRWANHLYSCDYVYAGGRKMTLSVKEMSSVAETTAYFDALAKKLHRAPELVGLGEGGFNTRDGSVVVRKDYRVLLVDVSHLPARFGTPPLTRSAFATSVATTIMGCWIGA